ncbi:peptide deformylase [Marinobacter xestospongiae]|uniref:Peptide deformylase n=1 Tax=Marinobacter xestospongiae TaxID=994319 RepID=A0ABU3W3H3_9GAMM|nr:peptide deformylase [Marinobacter xestospongiae]MDV2081097.1 peptide deformylase [Marinobacter xestospongiae]
MAVLPILTLPDSRLRRPARPVTSFSDAATLVRDMLDTLYVTTNGIGLAATQVGRPEAVVVIDLSANRDQPLVLINPEITHTQGQRVDQEGCLSVPDYTAEVTRYETIGLAAYDLEGQCREWVESGFLATVIQHELDHLQGRLFIDHLPPVKRRLAQKKLAKQGRRARGALA